MRGTMDITINRIVFASCIAVILLAIMFGIISVFDENFRQDILLVGPAIMAPLITLATAMAGMYRASKGFNGGGAPPPREPDGNYNPGDKDER
jgi:Na+/proline symporter